MEWKIALVPIPVSDVDLSKAFYTEKVGFHLDHDFSPAQDVRVVQMTPPGSDCSVVVGSGIVETPPGSIQGLQLMVSDIYAARAQFIERGVGVTEVQFLGPGVPMAYFSDPDGNSWALQQVPA